MAEGRSPTTAMARAKAVTGSARASVTPVAPLMWRSALLNSR